MLGHARGLLSGWTSIALRSAAIMACHAEAESWQDTDWPQILALYDLLLSMSPSPVIQLNRAVALRYVAGPAAALSEIEALAHDLEGYHLFHSIRYALWVRKRETPLICLSSLFFSA